MTFVTDRVDPDAFETDGTRAFVSSFSVSGRRIGNEKQSVRFGHGDDFRYR